MSKGPGIKIQENSNSPVNLYHGYYSVTNLQHRFFAYYTDNKLKILKFICGLAINDKDSFL